MKRSVPTSPACKIHNQVAILWSRDSANAIDFMPYGGGVPAFSWSRTPDGYGSLVQQIHHSLYDLNIGSDFVFPTTQDFSAYKLLIVPALYIADDALLQRISDYVKAGGHVVMTFKSGFANENSAVRWVRAPGPLREAAGFSYQEFSNLEHPLALKGDPFHAGAENQGAATGPSSSCPSTPRPLHPTTTPSSENGRPSPRTNSAPEPCSMRGPISPTSCRQRCSRGTLEKVGLTGPTSSCPQRSTCSTASTGWASACITTSTTPAREVKVTYAYGAGANLLDGKPAAKAQELDAGALGSGDRGGEIRRQPQ